MKRVIGSGLATAALATAMAAERTFDFSKDQLDQPPAGFRQLLVGEGQPGDWRVVLDEVPPALAPLTPNAPSLTKQRVLAQLSRDATDERFPLLVFEEESFGDFTLTARFKIVDGKAEQMAGIVFRLQDEKNFYVARASALGNNFRFYRVANGLRDKPVGPELPITRGVWHELTIACKGNRIRLRLDGQEAVPELTDNSFTDGKIGFWTKSDSVSYFRDVRIDYTPREYLAQALIRDALQRYPRLLGLKIFATTASRPELRVVASSDPKDLNQPARDVEKETVAKDVVYCGQDSHRVTVTMPLHDRNGDAIAAVRVIMRSFPGQTEQNAVARASPIVKSMEARVRSLKDLTE